MESLSLVYGSFPILFIMFYIILTFNKWIYRQDVTTKLFNQCSKVCFYICIFQWTLLILLGLYSRVILGLDRGELLNLEHNFLISGTSFVYIFAFVYIVRKIRLKGVICIIVAFLAIDLIFMGKKFVFYLLALSLFRVDSHSYIKSIKPVILALSGGVTFVLAIFIIRALATNSPLVLGLYSIFSEFIGVVSTVGFALEYGQNIDSIWKVVSDLQPFYYDSVGHGLALNPVSYFIITGGDNWFVALIIYAFIFILIFYVFSMLLGDLVLLILLMNIIHFFRHGPDIFLFQFVTQAFAVTFIMYLGLLKKKNLIATNLKKGSY
ncbi:hypothetical protein ACPUVO_18930 [Pseudocolwellia sp. HL-MZ19]|uniref:hypothetical protein n=1 Tax=Pseudocolwellia sp. HL-MZ19 TaxID=3400846 RepID=UPI003CEAE5F3